jgi:hypothetical protein
VGQTILSAGAGLCREVASRPAGMKVWAQA